MSSVYPAFDNPALREAVRRAKESFPFFVREQSWEQRRIVKALGLSAVKLSFDVPKGGDAPETEHMWISDVGFDGKTVSGTLLNGSDYIPGMVPGRDVSAPFERLDDWMYVCDGMVCGGFTVQAMRADMDAAERKGHDEAWGLPFTDPALCNITPFAAEKSKPASGLSRLWKKATASPGLPYQEALAHARAYEHPMSENARESIAESLRASPEWVTQPMEDGWTVLHKEAFAGNLAPVEVLLELGADRDARTPDGRTPLDLAKAMGWDRIVQALTR
ncbi:DUF2314 domain-containing protein [uncultured Brevundimonas sp.]|uniref:DUF2314 domain-containing protein n=1 Tax=uncultured Brevundimonas sp. TaxID=213418 RepID=UPI002616B73B|nr:DUF2314 domain-containing protein [uncultured Brevundimonas sp.]